MIEVGDVLVTGSSSGLGKHCLEIFKGVAYARELGVSDALKKARNKPYRLIIHSAFDTQFNFNHTQLYDYLNNTSLLTQKLIQIPHEKFIFISSVDVYPKNNVLHEENEKINLKDVENIYGVSKLMSESIIQNEAKNGLILRLTALLGKYARPNSVIKILTQKDPLLTLAGNSEFNYIRHDDVSDFIIKATKDNICGIYNLAASLNINILDVSRHFGRLVNFGDYTYKTGSINNNKALSVLDNFKRTSLDNVEIFMKGLQAQKKDVDK